MTPAAPAFIAVTASSGRITPLTYTGSPDISLSHWMSFGVMDVARLSVQSVICMFGKLPLVPFPCAVDAVAESEVAAITRAVQSQHECLGTGRHGTFDESLGNLTVIEQVDLLPPIALCLSGEMFYGL